MLCSRIYLLMIGRNKYEPAIVAVVLINSKPRMITNNIFCFLKYVHNRKITCFESLGFSTKSFPRLPGSPAGNDFMFVGSLMQDSLLLAPGKNKSPGKPYFSLIIPGAFHLQLFFHRPAI